jgi:hypothetical protein
VSDKYSADKELTQKHELTQCSMGRCCNAQKIEELSKKLEEALNRINDEQQ